MAGSFRCIAPDLLGLGDTETPADADWSLPAQEAMVLGLLDSLDLDQASVVGHDHGGAVACRTLIGAYRVSLAPVLRQDEFTAQFDGPGVGGSHPVEVHVCHRRIRMCLMQIVDYRQTFSPGGTRGPPPCFSEVVISVFESGRRRATVVDPFA
jgi:Alpha/beta hydrolase family